MLRRTTVLACLACASVAWTSAASAEDPRFHATAGAAHALGGPQQREFGAGGGGSATIELPVGGALGVQANAGGVVLSAGDAPADGSIAPKSTGTAFLGTLGVRFRPFGSSRVAGPWIDANGGLAQTGSRGRLALDAHVGWDFRISKSSRWDIGPFVGFTQIFQPSETLSSADARVGWAGLQVSLGAPERKAPPPAPVMGEAPPPPGPKDEDALATAFDICPPPSEIDGSAPEGCPSEEVKIVGDRLVLGDVIHFEFNSPVIRKRSYGLVKRVAEFIAAHPDIVEVSIEGHADARGTLPYNQKLSEARAESTLALLVERGVDPVRLRVIGHGKTRLKVDTQMADPRNRRVEFIVTRGAHAANPSHAPARFNTSK